MLSTGSQLTSGGYYYGGPVILTGTTQPQPTYTPQPNAIVYYGYQPPYTGPIVSPPVQAPPVIVLANTSTPDPNGGGGGDGGGGDGGGGGGGSM